MAKKEEIFAIGDMAPTFSLPAANGEQVSLKDFAGKYVIIYFYPKDNTPGCTTEACDFRDYHQDFSDLNAIIVGISPDPIKSHQKFSEKYNLPFILLSDEDHQVAESYGTWVLKKMYGKEYMGIERSTFIIDPEGKVIKAFRKVKVKGHVEAALDFLRTQM